MKIKILMTFMIFCLLNGCSKEKIVSELKLNGNWKITTFQQVQLGEVTDDEAKLNIGAVGTIKSNVLKIRLFDKQYSGFIDANSKKLMKVTDDDYFNPTVSGASNPKLFKLTSKIYDLKMKLTGKSETYNLNIVVDGSGSKMVIGFKGPDYLLERCEY